MISSQKFLLIEDVNDDLVFLKDGSVSLIIMTSAVNFGLLFETEQIAIIDSFAGLINSLSFPIQIVIRSTRLDVSSYLNNLDLAINLQSNPLLRSMTISYRHFVESIIKEKNVLDKQFYVIINVTSPELGLVVKNKDERAKKATTILLPRRDHLLRQLFRLGLKAKQLTTVELIRLFYDIYNFTGNDPVKGFVNQTKKLGITQSTGVSDNPEIRKSGNQSPSLGAEPSGRTPESFQKEFSQPPSPIIPPHPLPSPAYVAPASVRLTPPFIVEELSDDSKPR